MIRRRGEVPPRPQGRSDEKIMKLLRDIDPEIARAIASDEGIPELTEAHWKVIEFCRQSATSTGKAPTLRTITTGAGITTKEMFALFPKGPAKKGGRKKAAPKKAAAKKPAAKKKAPAKQASEE